MFTITMSLLDFYIIINIIITITNDSIYFVIFETEIIFISETTHAVARCLVNKVCGGSLPMFLTAFLSREKLTKEVRNVVTCDITLFKPIDTPFFNSAVIGTLGHHSYVDGDDCKLIFISTTNDVGTPCYISASMENLQNKVKEQVYRIENLEKKSCKSNEQKRCCCNTKASDPVDCACDDDCCEDDCDVAPDCSDEAWRDGN